MEAVDPRKRRSLVWAWILLTPIVVGAAFCTTFGPFLYQRGLARRLEAQGVHLTNSLYSDTWFHHVMRTVPGFQGYGFKWEIAIVQCEDSAIRTKLPQIAKDLRSLGTDVHVYLTANISEELALLGANKIVGVSVRDCVVTATDLKLLQTQLQLRDLSLTNCKLDEAAFEELGRLKSLQTLYLDGSAITDEGLKHLNGLKSLINLGLSNTQTPDGAKEALLKGLPDLQVSDD